MDLPCRIRSPGFGRLIGTNAFCFIFIAAMTRLSSSSGDFSPRIS